MKTPGQIFHFCILKTFTTIFFITFSVILLPQIAFPQLADSFEDADLSVNPAWQGSLHDFTTTQGQLHLKALPVSGSSFLSTQSKLIQEAAWEFSVQFLFNPSSTNHARIYLASDQPTLNQPLQGYFIQVGNAQDEISLYHQSGTTLTKIIDGTDGKLNLDEVKVRIKVVCSVNGIWQLFTSSNEANDFVLEGTSVPQPILSSSWFGVLCTYTATRSDKFFFDNISVTSFSEQDTNPPVVESAIADTETILLLTFNEAVSHSTATEKSNYLFVNENKNPSEVSLSADGRVVTLITTEPFPRGTPVMLKISGIKDVSGNALTSNEIVFTWIAPEIPGWKDIIISEILCDPEPSAGLPNAEFIEIFNRSNKPFELDGWTISDGSSSAVIGKLILFPRKYAVLTSSATVSLFAGIENVYPVSGWPSLNNSGDLIKLITKDKVVVDSVQYNSSWYKDSQKKDGGWSLEIIDPGNHCGDEDNWSASESDSGGTPGLFNSVFSENPDLRGPILLDVYAIDPNQIILLFDEKLNKVLPEVSSFEITPSVNIAGLSIDPSLVQINLSLSNTLDPAFIYNIQLKNIYDCSGNIISEGNSGSFVLPMEADSLDILYNEILFNPWPGGSDFIELVNTSTKNIDLKNWSAGILKDGKVTELKSISHIPLIFKPGTYLAFSSDAAAVVSHYPLADPLPIRSMILPSFNDEEGTVVLVNPSGKIMDQFSFHDDWHSVFIQNTEGVSLERISTSVASTSIENWKSSSAQAGFATPGYRNSNNLEADVTGNEVSILPEAFVPVTGFPDFTTIQFRLERPGLIANIKILNAGGQLIKTLAENTILGTETFIRWDGDRNDGTKSPVGSYMIYIEIFDSSGYVRKIRKRVGIGGQF